MSTTRVSRVDVVAAAAASACIMLLFVLTAGWWPWDHDEVHGLMELGVIPLGRYPGPAAQLERMHRLVPVWHVVQNAALTVVPHNEWGTRLVGSISGALVIVFSLAAGLRARGRWFGWSLFVILAGSQSLIWLAQQNRFYAPALLLATLAALAIQSRDGRFRYDVVAILFGIASVLTHNLLVVTFGLASLAAAAAWLLGSMSTVAVRRTLLTGAATAGAYLLYLRPLLAGWMSGNTGGTSPLVSFVAQVGIVPIALAMFGCALAIWSARERFLRFWGLLFVLSVGFVAVSPWIVPNWNPRYGLFFMPPVWVMAAGACEAIAVAAGSSWLAVSWLAAVSMLMAPKVASHFLDGSRHDFRTASQIVAATATSAPVLSNWPADLQYYLEPKTGQRAQYWAPGSPLPAGETVIVYASNAWEPVIRMQDRVVRIVGEVARRRFDEQSHMVRVYVVEPERR